MDTIWPQFYYTRTLIWVHDFVKLNLPYDSSANYTADFFFTGFWGTRGEFTIIFANIREFDSSSQNVL